MSLANEKRTSGAAIASRLTTSAAACASARSDFRNLSRAGVAANRSRASTRVPTGAAQGSIALLAPSSTTSLKPVAAPSRGCGFRAATPRRSRAAPRRGSRRWRWRSRSPSGIFDVACRSTQARGRFVHAAPVVGDADQRAPAGLDRDLDAARPGVERVLDQFLDRRRRPLDHLARGDAVDEQRIETANWHGEPRRPYRIGGRAGEGGLYARCPYPSRGRGFHLETNTLPLPLLTPPPPPRARHWPARGKAYRRGSKPLRPPHHRRMQRAVAERAVRRRA